MDAPDVTALLRVLTDSLVQGVLVLDERGGLQHANGAARRRLGMGTRLRVGTSVDAVLRGRFGLSVSRCERLLAGEPQQVGPADEPLDLQRVVLPGTGWAAIVLEEHRLAPTAPLEAPVVPSHDALWTSLVRAVECGHDVGSPVAVFTAVVDPPVEVAALCQSLRDHARAGEVVGFVDPARVGVTLADEPGPILAAIVAPGCAGVAAAERRRALDVRLRSHGWRVRVGAAAVRLDWDTGNGWLAEDRAAALVRQAVDSAASRVGTAASERDQRRLSAAPRAA